MSTAWSSSSRATLWFYVPADMSGRLSCGHLVPVGWPIAKDYNTGRTRCRQAGCKR